MGFADFFRPKHRHSDLTVRTQVVRELAADDTVLVEMALRDRDPGIRRLAIGKLEDPSVLASIASHDSDDSNRNAATNRACEIWSRVACGSNEESALVALDGLTQLADGRGLARVGATAALAGVRARAIAAIRDDRGLVDLARATNDAQVRDEALARVHSVEALRGLATSASDKELGLAIIERLTDEDALDAIAHKGKHKAVRARARKKLAGLAEAKHKPDPIADETKRRRAAKAQLLRELESWNTSFDVAAGMRAMETTNQAWSALGASDRDLDAKLTAQVQTLEKRFVAIRAAAHKATTPAVKEPAANVVATDSGTGEPDVGFAAGDSVDAAAADARRLEREAKAAEREAKLAARQAREKERAEKDAQRAQREQARREAAVVAQRQLVEMVAEMERMVQAGTTKNAAKLLGESNKVVTQLQKLDAEFDRDPYEAVRGKLVILTQANKDAEDWQRFANVPKAESLVKDAEVLLASVHEVPEHVGQLLKDLQAEWKALGPLPQKRSQELWETFKATCDQIYEVVKAQRAEADVKYDAIAAKKEALITEAESLATSTDWAATAKRLKELQTAWKDAGSLPRRRADELWTRFKSACDTFFAARAPQLKAERDQEAGNLAKKVALCEQLEAMVAKAGDDAAWPEVLRTVRNAQRDWKDIGYVPRQESQPIYERFRAACDGLFAARDNAKGEHAKLRANQHVALMGELQGAADVTQALSAHAQVRALDAEELTAEIRGAWNAMVSRMWSDHAAAVQNTPLDPRVFASERRKILQRANELVSPEAPSLANDSATDVATRLQQAMADNALAKFRFGGREPAELISELRDEWMRVGPSADPALDQEFAAVCAQVLSEAGVGQAARRSETPRKQVTNAAPPLAAVAPVATIAAGAAAATSTAVVAGAAAALADNAFAATSASIGSAAPRTRAVSSPPPMDDVDTAWDAAEEPSAAPQSASPPSASELAGDASTEGEGLDTGWD